MHNKKYIKFYQLVEYPLHRGWFEIYPQVRLNTYGFVCKRTYIQCIKIGIRHILRGDAFMFKITKAKNKSV